MSIKVVQGVEKGKAQLVTVVAILQALELAEQLNNFIAPQEISPLQLMKLQGKKRQRASARKANKEHATYGVRSCILHCFESEQKF